MVVIIRSRNDSFLIKQLKYILEYTCSANVVKDRFIHNGRACKNITGSKGRCYSEMINAYINRYVYPEDRKTVQEKCSCEYIMSHLSEKEPFYVFDYRRIINNEYRWYRMHIISATQNKAKSNGDVILAVMDVDEVKQTEYAFYEELNRANKAKSDFLSNISHDIRTPMNAVVGFTALLERHADNPDKVREDVARLQASGRHLLCMINDILDMNKMESHMVTINNSDFELSSFLEDICTVTRQLARDKKQNFIMELIDIKNNMIVGDKTRLNQILINILSNSVKYTGEGGEISLIVRGFPDEPECHLQFEVKDNGIGMSKEFIERIFEPFTREEERIPMDISGTGLGMAITKNLVELMEGSIHVESEPDKGSKFTVDLVFGTALTDNIPDKGRDGRGAGSASLAGMNFLIAEDNKINGEIISELLKLEGALSTVCSNGREAVDTFTGSPGGTFDMILMDVRMPVMNGYEAAKAIRQSGVPDAGNIPILSMSANSATEDILRAGEAGMNGYISKPIDMETFKATINSFIGV
ncbi:MAG: hybrid sensor histidine kinase/response regulator [Butyrivibrio sp.]